MKREIAAGLALLCGGQIHATSCDHRSGPFVTGDYLYWQVAEDDLTYAVLGSQFLMSGQPQSIRIIDQQPEFASGFRFGLGYNFSSWEWALSLNWTCFDTTSTSSITAKKTPERVIATLLAGALPAPNAGTAVGANSQSQWHLKLNMLEFQLGHPFLLAPQLFFYPHVGLQGGWISQSQHIAYNQFFDIEAHLNVDATVARTNNSAGIGPKIGLNSRWHMGSQFGIFGHIALAGLYGIVQSQALYLIQEGTLPFSNTEISRTQHLLRPNAQFQLGADWSYCISGWALLSLSACYELQYWWSQWQWLGDPQSVLSAPPTGNGDLQFQGLTLQATIAF